MLQRLMDLREDLQLRIQERTQRLITRRLPLPPEVASWRVAFCGASVGRCWHLPWVYPQVRMVPAYTFDKGELIETALAEAPQALILKQCAAYFPERGGDADRRALVSWLEGVVAAGTKPIVATVVPVSARHGDAHPGRAQTLWAFNEWLRELAAERGWALLDLERALRRSAHDRHLRPGLDSGDGLHLRYGTYRAYMDHLLPQALLDAYEAEQ